MCQKISKTTVQCQEYLTALLQTVAHEKFTFCPSAPALADEDAAFITDATKVQIRTRLERFKLQSAQATLKAPKKSLRNSQ